LSNIERQTEQRDKRWRADEKEESLGSHISYSRSLGNETPRKEVSK
jgi:RNA polymerase sigma-70 factor, ECF subfamily